MKIIKLIVGMLFLSGLGLLYGKLNTAVDDGKEIKSYSYISFEFPGGELNTIQIKEIPKSKCEKIREEYFQASSEQCTNCKVIFNECRAIKPELFSQALLNKDLDTPYIFKPYKYPEATFFQGFTKEAFEKMCQMEKESLNSSVCIE